MTLLKIIDYALECARDDDQRAFTNTEPRRGDAKHLAHSFASSETPIEATNRRRDIEIFRQQLLAEAEN